MAHDVFISYASQDKPIADAICAKLEERRIRCWIAPRDVWPSQDWGEAIVAAIDESSLTVLVFSGNANSSDHVKDEVERAVGAGKPIVPLRVQDVLPSGSLALHLSRRHWLDAWTPPLEQHLQQLADVVEQLLSLREPVAPPPETEETGKEGAERPPPTEAPHPETAERAVVVTPQVTVKEEPRPPVPRAVLQALTVATQAVLTRLRRLKVPAMILAVLLCVGVVAVVLHRPAKQIDPQPNAPGQLPDEQLKEMAPSERPTVRPVSEGLEAEREVAGGATLPDSRAMPRHLKIAYVRCSTLGKRLGSDSIWIGSCLSTLPASAVRERIGDNGAKRSGRDLQSTQRFRWTSPTYRSACPAKKPRWH